MYYKWSAWQAQKGKGDGKGKKVQKRRKGKGTPAIRAQVFAILSTNPKTSTDNTWPMISSGAS